MRTINQYIEENKRTIKLNLNGVHLDGFTQPLRVTWSHEAIQDIQAFHNIDVEAELVRMLSVEIDREILNNVINMGLNV